MAEWRDVPFWCNYVVSDEGEVARKDTGQILKTYPQKSGYVNIWLSRDSGRKAVPLHRVVAMAFHGTKGYEQGMFVDHIDTNRANNRADNLHWVTPKENMNNPNTLSKRKKQRNQGGLIMKTNKLFEECLEKVDPEVMAEVSRNVDALIAPNGVTKKELIELLKPFPDDAIVVVEYCNIREMVYDEKYNTIRID